MRTGHEALAADGVTAERFEPWEREMRVGADLFIGAVQAFYTGDLPTYLFAEPQHPISPAEPSRRCSRATCSIEDARWAREMRTRFPALLR